MIRKSKFDPGIMCYEAGLDAPQSLRDTLDERGPGFALFGEDVATPMIGIDAAAGLSRAQMIAVEAHEVGHILTGSEDEETAELFAIALLRASGYHTSAQLLLDRAIQVLIGKTVPTLQTQFCRNRYGSAKLK